ncbi:MAG: cell wall-binding repeat-containing protein [Candidatus Limnocylindrales bacterium]
MSRRVLAVVATCFFLLAMLLPGTALAAQPQQNRFKQVDTKVDQKLTPFLKQSAKTVSVILEMSGKPVALTQAEAGHRLSTSAAAAARAPLKAAQDRIIPRIKALGGTIVGQMQTAYNGIHVRIAASRVTQLARLAGVVKVHRAPVFSRDNVNSVPYIGAPSVWEDTGATGAGIKIGDIDTGLDFYHANFGGTGVVADYTYGFAHSTAFPALNADLSQAFPSTKVAGGWDFVGDAYDADTNPFPVPDPNPLDCPATSESVGHGSHTAGTAAGFGVLSNGATYTGSYDASTLSGNSFRIGPGVAPEATLYAYRVFGCQGTTDVVVEAIDRAVLDGMDVINMSLGSPFGLGDSPDAVASDNAAAAGTVVATSSGNEGPGAYMTGSPGVASRAINTAAVDAFPRVPQALVNLPTPQADWVGNNMNGATLPLTDNLSLLDNGAGGLALGCSQADYNNAVDDVSGTIVAVKRGVCAFVDKGALAQANGAVGIIVVNRDDTPVGDLPVYIGPVPNFSIPMVGVAKEAQPDIIASDGASITLSDNGTVANPTYQDTASFSSGGPRSGDSLFKPDLSAPGVSVTSTQAGSGNLGETLSGTSMASPHTAGSAALVLQTHPGWTNMATRVDKVKAALMGTADASTAKILAYDPRIDGAGMIDLPKAANAVTYATTTDHNESLSYGYQPTNGELDQTKSFTIWNDSGSPVDYDLASQFVGSDRGALIDIPPSVTVPAHGSVTVDATLVIDATSVANLPTADMFGSGGAGPGLVTSLSGAVVATPTDGATGVHTLRVPFLVVPRGLSEVAAQPHSPFQNHDGISTAGSALTNPGIHEGTADVYAWGLSDPSDPGLGSNDLRAAGVEAFPLPDTASTTKVAAADQQVVFAVNVWNRWSNAATSQIEVAIDTNRDGDPDFYLFAQDLGDTLAGDFNGQLAVFTTDADFNILDIWFADAPMNGSVAELPTLASDLGLTPTSGPFEYQIADFSLDDGSLDFFDGVARFDPYHPAVSNGDFISLAGQLPILAPKPKVAAGTTNLALTLDQELFAHAPAMGWMVVTLDDPNGDQQADLIPVGKVAARLFGADRYGTAAAISSHTFAPGVPFAYVASGTDFPDGLAAGPAAASMGGPVLLVPPAGPIPQSIKDELTRLKPNKIIVVGGPSAVSDAVKTALQPYQVGLGSVQRIAGSDRYATAAQISAFAFPTPFTAGNGTVFVATGANFPDALAAGPAAAHKGGPLLLVPGTGALPSSVTAELTRLKPNKIIVVGSSSVISSAEMTALDAFDTGGGVSRLFGPDRYGTAAAISQAIFDPGVPAAYIATGLNFPDALAGSAAAGFVGGPILLVQTNEVPIATANELQRLEPDQIYVLGSSSVVTDQVANGIGPFIAP